jgi:hypothetical protein
VLRDIAPCLWLTTDIINWGLIPYEIKSYISQQHGQPFAINNANHWTNSCSYVTEQFCDWVIERIIAVDAGAIPLPPCESVSDEGIIRQANDEHGRWKIYADCGISPVGVMPAAPLQHYPRSSLLRGINEKYPIEKYPIVT